MKRFIFLLILALFVTGCHETTDKPTLTIYTYSSLAADGGLLPAIQEQFEKDHNVELNIVSFPDSGAMMAQVWLEADAPKADVVLGFDNIDFVRWQNETDPKVLFQSYKPQTLEIIPADLRFDDAFTAIPFDYGYIGFIYDSERIQFSDTPISLATLATKTYQDKIVIPQAGASSPGTQLLLWTNAALGDVGADQFWINFAKYQHDLTADWGTAYYSYFLTGQNPIVLSYLTSPAYHIAMEQTDRYKAIPIQEGYLRQIEGVAITAHTEEVELAQYFVDYLLSDAVQNQIPTTQWMLPVNANATLPPAYDHIIMPSPDEVLTPTADQLSQIENWIIQWDSTMGIRR